jgi:hypothetical protein
MFHKVNPTKYESLNLFQAQSKETTDPCQGDLKYFISLKIV